MAVKKYFDGNVLREVELPNRRLPGVLAVNNDHLSPLNPTGADPALLPVDVSELPDLKPTAGAHPSRKFPEPLPGSGEGAGVGQPSGRAIADPWANNPLRDPGTAENLQRGPIGSKVGAQEADATSASQEGTQGGSGDTTDTREPDDHWTKAELGDYIEANGGERPADSEQKEVFIAKAQEVHSTKQLA